MKKQTVTHLQKTVLETMAKAEASTGGPGKGWTATDIAHRGVNTTAAAIGRSLKALVEKKLLKTKKSKATIKNTSPCYNLTAAGRRIASV